MERLRVLFHQLFAVLEVVHAFPAITFSQTFPDQLRFLDVDHGLARLVLSLTHERHRVRPRRRRVEVLSTRGRERPGLARKLRRLAPARGVVRHQNNNKTTVFQSPPPPRFFVRSFGKLLERERRPKKTNERTNAADDDGTLQR